MRQESEFARKGREHEERVEADRARLGSRKIEFGRIPKWILRPVQIADTGCQFRTPKRSGSAAFLAMTDAMKVNHNRLFDHWGTSEIVTPDGQKAKALVTEPYPFDGLEQAAQAFARLVGVAYRTGEPSWHYPDHCARVEFFPKEPE